MSRNIEQTDFIVPIFRTNRFVKHLIFWFAVLFFFSVFDYLTSPENVIGSVLINLVYLPQDIVLVYIILYFLIPRLYMRRRYVIFVLSLLLVLLVNVLFSFAIDYMLVTFAGEPAAERVLAQRIFYSIIVFTFIASLASVFKLLSINSAMQLKKETAESRFHKAELALLRSQINPHFLFNVFNNIDELIYKDRETASEILVFLSDSLRYVLQEQDNDYVPVNDEIDFIRSYLKVASTSFNNSAFIEFKAEDDRFNSYVAPLVFIPFVENAVKHCNRRAEVPGIKITIHCRKEYVRIICHNSLKEDGEKARQGGGFGLSNAKKRLDLIYGDSYSLSNTIKDGTYTADLKIMFT